MAMPDNKTAASSVRCVRVICAWNSVVTKTGDVVIYELVPDSASRQRQKDTGFRHAPLGCQVFHLEILDSKAKRAPEEALIGDVQPNPRAATDQSGRDLLQASRPPPLRLKEQSCNLHVIGLVSEKLAAIPQKGPEIFDAGFQ